MTNLTYNNWLLSLDLNGGRIQELTYKGIKIFGTYQRIDGKMGNTHICAPSFDKEGQEKYGLPFHGYARTLKWESKKLTANTVQIKTVTHSTETYPAQLELIQEFVLDTVFTHTITVKHLRGLDVPVNIGIHYYWDTPQGWNEITIKNRSQKELIKTNGYMNLEEKNSIIFPHASYELTSCGFNSAMLWTSFKTDTTGNKIYNHDFCCIEPIIGWPGYFTSPASILGIGKTISASVQIKKIV